MTRARRRGEARRLSPFALPFALLFAFACDAGAPIPTDDLKVVLRVEGANVEASRVHDVDLGRAFDLELVRSRRKGTRVAPLPDAPLPPLTLALVDATTREDSRSIEETFRFRAYAFDPGDLIVPSASFGATTEDGETRTARSEPFSLRVASALSNDASPSPEPPPDLLLLEDEAPPYAAAAGFAAALALAGALLRRRRSRARRPPTPSPEPPPSVVARGAAAIAAIEALKETDPARRVVALAAITRAFVDEAFGVPAFRRTTEEVAAAFATAAKPSRPKDAPRLLGVLKAADSVKFAARAPKFDETATLEGDLRAALAAEAEIAAPEGRATGPSP
jgi:hypothetical protein